MSDDSIFDQTGAFVVIGDLIDASAWCATGFADLRIIGRGDGTIIARSGANSVWLLDDDDTVDPDALVADGFIFAPTGDALLI